MKKVVIPDIKHVFSNWVNKGRTKDSEYYRNVVFVSNDENKFVFCYSISYSKVHSRDERKRNNLGKAIKFGVKILTGMPLLLPPNEPTEDTYCKLLLERISMEGTFITLKYKILVCDGSFFHKKIVGANEWNVFGNMFKSESCITTKDSVITIDMSKINVDGIKHANIRDVYINEKDLVLEY